MNSKTLKPFVVHYSTILIPPAGYPIRCYGTERFGLGYPCNPWRLHQKTKTSGDISLYSEGSKVHQRHKVPLRKIINPGPGILQLARGRNNQLNFNVLSGYSSEKRHCCYTAENIAVFTRYCRKEMSRCASSLELFSKIELNNLGFGLQLGYKYNQRFRKLIFLLHSLFQPF